MGKRIGKAGDGPEMNGFHTSVLTKEVIDFLRPSKGKLFIDATAGGGGHTFELLRRGAKVLALDRDPEAIEHIKSNINYHVKDPLRSEASEVRQRRQISNIKIGRDLILVRGNFNRVGEIAKANGFGAVSGILFDLGVSSYQIDTAPRGFSFQKKGPLDMRMDPSLKITAADIINNFDKRRLNEIFKHFGQEKLSWPIADAIYRARQIKKIETTQNLAQIVRGVYSKRGESRKQKLKIDPATKVFQSLRIVVNSELINLEETLPQTVDLLESEGRLVTISFHSLEDTIVKRFFKHQSRLRVLTKTPIGPSEEEKTLNPRSRSARLRAAEKI